MSFLIVQFKFSILVTENLKFEWQCSEYLELNPTCAPINFVLLVLFIFSSFAPDATILYD